MAGSGETVTYRQLDEQSNRIAQLFRSLGLKAGDHIALFLENNPRFFEICWGAQRSGLIYTAISSRLTAAEVDYIVADCGARLFVTSKYLAAPAAELAPLLKGVEKRFMIDGTIAGYESWEATVARFPADADRRPDRGPRHALFVGHHRAAQGRAAGGRAAADRLRQSAAGHHAQALRHGREHDLSVAGAALSRGAAALQHERHAAGRHLGDHGAFRRRGILEARRQVQERRTPRSCRPCSCAS